MLKKTLATSLLAILLSLPTYGQDEHARALADKMLDHLGGRETWASLRNTVNGSQQNRTGEPTVVYAVITMDFKRSRFRIETTAQDLRLIRVIDGEDSWRLTRSGKVEEVPQALFDDEMKWYNAHLYRTIHRIAADDPELLLSLGADGRLEVTEKGKRILWFKLDARGEPYQFGAWEDEVGSLSGPWDVIRDGIHHPRWVSSADGTWRAAVKALEINVPLHEGLFLRPREK